MEACFILAYMVYKTASGIPCESPLEYEGKRYDGCISMDNGGIPWCSTQVDGNNNHVDGEWGNCGDTCDGAGIRKISRRILERKVVIMTTQTDV